MTKKMMMRMINEGGGRVTSCLFRWVKLGGVRLVASWKQSQYIVRIDMNDGRAVWSWASKIDHLLIAWPLVAV
jgi:hypothetical protein